MEKAYKSPCYCTNLRRSANAVSEFYDEGLKAAGITVPQYYLLINIKRLKSANITHWARHVGLDRSTMVRNLKPLEARGLVERTDGRGKTFTLSAEGARVLDVAVPIWEERQREIEGALGAEDAENLLRIADKLQALK